MQSKPLPKSITRHARIRKKQRAIPDEILEIIKTGKAFFIKGYDANYHIVRQSRETYVVGVETESTLVTVVTMSKKRILSALSRKSPDKANVKTLDTLPILGSTKTGETLYYMERPRPHHHRKKKF